MLEQVLVRSAVSLGRNADQAGPICQIYLSKAQLSRKSGLARAPLWPLDAPVWDRRWARAADGRVPGLCGECLISVAVCKSV